MAWRLATYVGFTEDTEIHESRWLFSVPGKQASQAFVLVGTVKEPRMGRLAQSITAFPIARLQQLKPALSRGKSPYVRHSSLFPAHGLRIGSPLHQVQPSSARWQSDREGLHRQQGPDPDRRPRLYCRSPIP